MNEVKLRRYQNLLATSGLGVITFGVWSVIKFLILLFNELSQYLGEIASMPYGKAVLAVVYFLIGVFLALLLSTRLIIGLGARSEAAGKKKRWLYLILAFMLAGLSTLNVLSIVILYDTQTVMSLIITFIVDLTSLITLVELIVASITVKTLTKEQAQKQAQEQAKE